MQVSELVAGMLKLGDREHQGYAELKKIEVKAKSAC